jgi:hypothetical protein
MQQNIAENRRSQKTEEPKEPKKAKITLRGESRIRWKSWVEVGIFATPAS